MMIIISYREHYERWYRHEREEVHDGDLDIRAADTFEAAVEYIAGRIAERPESAFAHIVVDDWQAAIDLANTRPDCGQAEESISLPGVYAYDDGWEERQDDRERRQREFRAAVAARLGVLSVEGAARKRAAEAEERRRQQAAMEAAREREERRTLAHLKAKYPDE